ncbi:NmrA family NAD(P)-binding protein [Roseomonas sp. PWR1]|uniref:NmrA family NAD(P)-binding protein n=1 Tax=Roseomonas nitratireducens TaxID=2820810 RepID=A0ABS4AXZ7_9PROT|nr:NAD(P)H-binding protein [Neoroseomonas nitratireducens]MBP0466221.1 NmrA family NAD(P)-binding protein [Neoroseomonas nitratireducens]
MAGKILVLGATGTVGTPLVANLLAAGEAVKAATRNATPVAGAEAVRFDLADAATHGPAFEGVDRAFILLPAGHLDIERLLGTVTAAAAARRVKVVLMSVFGVDADDSIPYRRAEIALERSGTPHVILRPNWFADNFHSFWLAGIRQGVIAVPAAEGRTSFIDVRDIAASAAAALRSDRFDGRAFNLTGPAALGYADAAAILSQASGRPIRYLPVDDASFIATLTGAGVPVDYAGFLASIFHPVREGWTAGVTGDVEALTGVAPRSLAAYAADNAARFRA